MKITIDGPAGAGKSTVAKLLAKKLGFLHLDSGALYRAIGYAAKEKNVDLDDERAVGEFLDTIFITVDNSKVLVNGRDVTSAIRKPESGKLASKVAKYKKVRRKVIEILRDIAKGKDIVIDGRDAGTNIFPEAEVKIYLTASAEERAKRRYKELTSKGFNVTYEEVLEEVKKRDKEDTEREIAPLKIPQGAVVIDTTGKSIDEVLKEILTRVEEING